MIHKKIKNKALSDYFKKNAEKYIAIRKATVNTETKHDLEKNHLEENFAEANTTTAIEESKDAVSLENIVIANTTTAIEESKDAVSLENTVIANTATAIEESKDAFLMVFDLAVNNTVANDGNITNNSSEGASLVKVEESAVYAAFTSGLESAKKFAIDKASEFINYIIPQKHTLNSASSDASKVDASEVAPVVWFNTYNETEYFHEVLYKNVVTHHGNISDIAS